MDGMNLRTGDLVIGTTDPAKSVYSSQGKKLIDTGVALVGSESDIDALQQTIKNAAMQTGGQIIEQKNTKKKTGKKIKNSSNYVTLDQSPAYSLTPVSNTPTPEPIQSQIEKPKPQQVYFENAFGKIRSAVESIVEHEAAFMLVFSSEEEIVFEPKVSETLAFTWNKITYSVYYPGVIFDWTDGVKKAMILFKAAE
jgi:hypothetical protein